MFFVQTASDPFVQLTGSISDLLSELILCLTSIQECKFQRSKFIDFAWKTDIKRLVISLSFKKGVYDPIGWLSQRDIHVRSVDDSAVSTVLRPDSQRFSLATGKEGDEIDQETHAPFITPLKLSIIKISLNSRKFWYAIIVILALFNG